MKISSIFVAFLENINFTYLFQLTCFGVSLVVVFDPRPAASGLDKLGIL